MIYTTYIPDSTNYKSTASGANNEFLTCNYKNTNSQLQFWQASKQDISYLPISSFVSSTSIKPFVSTASIKKYIVLCNQGFTYLWKSQMCPSKKTNIANRYNRKHQKQEGAKIGTHSQEEPFLGGHKPKPGGLKIGRKKVGSTNYRKNINRRHKKRKK